MSFGSSVGDCILLAQLAWNTYQGAKKACGEHDELTREVSSLYKVLNRLRKEISNPESQVNKASNDKRQELEEHAAGCEGLLKTMNNVLTKYNALTGEQRRGKRLWQKIKFGNGQTKDLAEIRIKLSTHTSAIMMSLNLCSLDSMGRVEAILGRVEARSASHGEQLHGIRKALHWVTANMAAASGEGSVWTSYTNDDQMFWRELRRELANEGYRSDTLQRHKRLIKNYVEELGNRGVFDDIPDLEECSPDMIQDPDGDSIDIRQSTPIPEGFRIESPSDKYDIATMKDNSEHSSSEGNAEDTESLASMSEPRIDHIEPVDGRSEDHDACEQHSHASTGSHIDGDTAGQDENSQLDIPLMTPVSVGDAAMLSEKVSLDFECIETTSLAANFDEDCPCVSTSVTSGDDGSVANIDPDASTVIDATFVNDISTSPTPETSEDVEVAEYIHSLDLLPDLGDIKQMSPMSKGSTDIRGAHHSPSHHTSVPPVIPSPLPKEKISLLEDVSDVVEEYCSTNAPDVHCCDETVVISLEPSYKVRSPYAVQIEEVLDEEFSRHTGSVTLEEWHTAVPSSEASQPLMCSHDESFSEDSYAESHSACEVVSVYESASDVRSEPPPPVSIEEVLDEDFSIDAHPNVSTTNATFDYNSDTGATIAWRDSVKSSAESSTGEKKSTKRVRFANTESTSRTSDIPATKWAPENLRFIFYRETRDFNTYRELQESYQALFDEAEGGFNSVDLNKPENTTTFITHSPYTPPATMYDLQYYRVPASYFHTFWHPQRVPIYLHGNVFDGISLTNWIYNWTAYTFKDDSYQMNAVRRLGTTVVKLGSALSDIEHAKPAVKASLPKDLYDESGVLWADFENIINDIMSEAEDRLEASKKGGRLEVEFVSRFCHELIAGKRYYRSIEKFLKKTEAWCKKARFHPDFIMLWELWEK